MAATLGHGLTITATSVTAITGIRSISGGDMTRSSHDVSTVASTDKYMEFLAGMIDPGELTFECVYDTANYTKLVGAIDSVAETWTLTLADTHTWACTGFLTGVSLPSADADGAVTNSFSIKFSGKPIYT
jgi:hypothetical protein